MTATILQLHQNRGIAYRNYVKNPNDSAKYDLDKANVRLQIEQQAQDSLPIATNPAIRVAELLKYCP